MPSDTAVRSVAFLSPGWPPGRVANGITTYVGNVRPGLERLGVTSSVLTTTDVQGEPDPAAIKLDRDQQPRVRDVVLKAARKLGGPRSFGIELGWTITQTLGALEASRRPDLVELEETFGAAYYVQQILPMPVVVRAHGPWFLNGAALGVPKDAIYRWRNWEERRCFASAHGVTSPSRDVLEQVRSHHGLPLPDAVVIPNPVPVIPAERRWQLAACEPRTILFVGRFDRHKGGDLVIDAFRRVVEAVPDARLVFVGPDRGLQSDDGKSHTLASYLAERLPAADRARVEVTGALPAAQIEGLRRRAFLTVIASRYENFPLALAEALAYGCPTIAADTGGIPEIVAAERTGLLFTPGDAGSLAARIVTLLGNRELAAALGREAAADMATRLSPDVVARATLDYYAETLARARRAPSTDARRSLWRALYAATGVV